MSVSLTGGTPPETEAEDKIVLLEHGHAGTGKTALAFSFPDPFWMFNLDRAVAHLWKQMPPTRAMEYEAFTIDVDSPTPGIAQQYLNKFDLLLGAAIKSGSNGTFIVDGWDIFWDIVKIAKVRNLDAGNDLPKEYAPANSYMNGILGKLGRSKLNVVFTTISSKVWTGAKTETDRMKADGFKHKDRMLTHEMYMFSPEDRRTPNEVPNPVATDVGQTHRGIITLSKFNEKLINRVVPNPNYALLYKLTFGKGYPEPDRLWSPAGAAATAQVPTPVAVEEGAGAA